MGPSLFLSFSVPSAFSKVRFLLSHRTQSSKPRNPRVAPVQQPPSRAALALSREPSEWFQRPAFCKQDNSEVSRSIRCTTNG